MEDDAFFLLEWWGSGTATALAISLLGLPPSWQAGQNGEQGRADWCCSKLTHQHAFSRHWPHFFLYLLKINMYPSQGPPCWKIKFKQITKSFEENQRKYLTGCPSLGPPCWRFQSNRQHLDPHHFPSSGGAHCNLIFLWYFLRDLNQNRNIIISKFLTKSGLKILESLTEVRGDCQCGWRVPQNLPGDI